MTGIPCCRYTGDTVELAQMQVFAIEAQDQKIDIHPEANPTAVSWREGRTLCRVLV